MRCSNAFSCLRLCVCPVRSVALESLGLDTLFLMCMYIFRICRSVLYLKVIRPLATGTNHLFYSLLLTNENFLMHSCKLFPIGFSMVTDLLLSRRRFRLLRLTMTTVIVWIQVMNPALRPVLMDGR